MTEKQDVREFIERVERSGAYYHASLSPSLEYNDATIQAIESTIRRNLANMRGGKMEVVPLNKVL